MRSRSEGLRVERAMAARRSAGQRAAPARGVATKAVNEIAMVANEAGFIAGTAFTMFGITLVVSPIGPSGAAPSARATPCSAVQPGQAATGRRGAACSQDRRG